MPPYFSPSFTSISQDTVREENLQALTNLKKYGFEVWLCSFGGGWTNGQTREAALELWDGWAGLLFCKERTGVRGKANFISKRGCSVIFDDNREVIDECKGWRIRTYPVPYWQEKRWKGETTYRSQAVEAFIREEAGKPILSLTSTMNMIMIMIMVMIMVEVDNPPHHWFVVNGSYMSM